MCIRDRAELDNRIALFNSRPHDLTEKEKAMQEKSTNAVETEGDIPSESIDIESVPVQDRMEVLPPEDIQIEE